VKIKHVDTVNCCAAAVSTHVTILEKSIRMLNDCCCYYDVYPTALMLSEKHIIFMRCVTMWRHTSLQNLAYQLVYSANTSA
jgi:hypothetical protein